MANKMDSRCSLRNRHRTFSCVSVHFHPLFSWTLRRVAVLDTLLGQRGRGLNAWLEIVLQRCPFPCPCTDIPLWCTEMILLKRNNPVKAQGSFWPPLAPQPGLCACSPPPCPAAPLQGTFLLVLSPLADSRGPSCWASRLVLPRMGLMSPTIWVST